MIDDRPIFSDTTTAHDGEPPSDVAASDTPRRSPSAGSILRELIQTVVSILVIFFVVRGLVQNFRIDGSSMEPNLHHHQYILVNKALFFHFDSYALLRLLPGYRDLPERTIYPVRMPRRGDVVVITAPPSPFDQTEKDYIKRVIGLPGETVLVRDGKVFIDGVALDEPYLAEGQRTDCGTGKLCEPYVVPPDAVVIMGDNRGNSEDSRIWDAEPGLPLDRVVGRAWVTYWPQQRWSVIPAQTYAADQP